MPCSLRSFRFCAAVGFIAGVAAPKPRRTTNAMTASVMNASVMAASVMTTSVIATSAMAASDSHLIHT